MFRASEGSMVAAWRPGPVTTRRAVEAVLVCLLAAQGARLIWAAVTPVGSLGDPAPPRGAAMALPADTSILERFNPFGVAAPGAVVLANGAVAPAAPAPPPISLTLHGVRASMFGDGGSAIIAGPDGKQAPYRVGEEIEPGVVLRSIRRDHAVVTRNGEPVRLVFGAPTPVPGQAPAPVIASGGPNTPAGAPAQAEGPRGFSVPASGIGAEALGNAGLRPGDLVTAVNGRRLESEEDQARLLQELASGGEVEIQSVRNGITMTTRARLNR